jgi:hypothetical protein
MQAPYFGWNYKRFFKQEGMKEEKKKRSPERLSTSLDRTRRYLIEPFT